MNKKFLVGFSVLGVAAAAFWACGDGDVITKGGDDELALLNYGPPFAEGDEGNMKTLLNQAMADCAADEACAAKMEGAEYVPPESSGEGDEGGEGGEGGDTPTTGSSSSKTGPVINTSSASVTPTGSSASGGDTPPASSAVVSDGTKPDDSCAPSPTSIQKGGTVTWTFTKASLPAGSSVQQVMDYNNMVNAATCEWTMTGSTEGTASAPCKTNTASATYASAGSYSATLKIGDKTINCGSVRVNGKPITGCTCTSPSLVEITDDPVATWSVSCASTNETIEKYTWTGASGTTASATYTFTKKDETVIPKVTISTAESDTTVTCKSPKVTDANDPDYEIDLTATIMKLEPGDYTIKSCAGGGQICCSTLDGSEKTITLNGGDCTAYAGQGWGSCGSGSCKAGSLSTEYTIQCAGCW